MKKCFILFLLLIVTACSSIRLRYSTPVKINNKKEGQLTVEKSYSTLGHAIACGITGIFYGGWCWAYLAIPTPWQREKLISDVRQDTQNLNLGKSIELEDNFVEFVSCSQDEENWDFKSSTQNSISFSGEKNYVLAKLSKGTSEVEKSVANFSTCHHDDTWIQHEGRGQAGGWISFTGKGASQNLGQAYLLAEGMALERLIQECKIPHKEARFFERCDLAEGEKIVAFARLSIKDNYCRQALYSKKEEKTKFTHQALNRRYEEYNKLLTQTL